MNEVTFAQRLYFAAVGLFALWVGVFGTLDPGEVDRALPWLVPPLHARFLGAVYLSAAFMLGQGVVARRQADVRAMTLLVTLWTGLLLVLSLFHLDAFDPHHKPVWFWFGAYVAYPAFGAWSLRVHGGLARDPAGSPLPRLAGRGFLVAGAATTALAAMLMTIPGAMVSVWPWKITPLLTQIYAAPFAAYGLGFWLLSRSRSWPEARIVVRGAMVFATFVLVASIIHRSLFVAGRLATWVWFGGFGGSLLLLCLLEFRHTSRRVRA